MNRYSEERARQDLDLSVIVPTFNRVENLRRLLHSLDTRECPDSIRFEVVIVDNGSEDGTLDMLRGRGARLQRFSLEVFEEEGSRQGESAQPRSGAREGSDRLDRG